MASACVCLYGFVSALSLSLFVGEWACPSRCIKPCHSHIHLKRTFIPSLPPTLPNPHYPSLRTNTLASPRKRGGGLQTSERLENSALLCDISNAGIFAIILSARRWGLIPISTINEIFRTIPRPTPTPLPCLLLPLHRTFPFPQPSQKYNHRLRPHQPFQIRTIPPAFLQILGVSL